MATSRLDSVIDFLVDTFTDAPQLAGVAVYDGPAATDSADMELIAVGDDDDAESDASSAEVAQSWANANFLRKEEEGAVVCVVVAQDGTVDVKERRARCGQIIAACEDILRADPSLGDRVRVAAITSIALRQQQSEAGVIVRKVFTVSYKVRI